MAAPSPRATTCSPAAHGCRNCSRAAGAAHLSHPPGSVLLRGTPAGDARFAGGALPGWADFNNGDIFYGMPDLEGRGFKVANDKHGPAIDPDRGDRGPHRAGWRCARLHSETFPALAGAPLNEERVCQYENSSNGDLLIDRHPTADNVVLVGAGSGHGFKHGPEVGRYAAELATGKLKKSRAALQPRIKG
jgi:glycine/D-amino acid oxidase-like deaminating enzyme